MVATRRLASQSIVDQLSKLDPTRMRAHNVSLDRVMNQEQSWYRENPLSVDMEEGMV